VILLLEGAPVLPGADAKFEIQNVDILAAIVFGLAALTDFFDGWLARRFGAQSLLGKLLDPLADKLLVVASMIILVEKQRLAGWIAVVLIVRDLGISIAANDDATVVNVVPLSNARAETLAKLLDQCADSDGAVATVRADATRNALVIAAPTWWCATLESLVESLDNSVDKSLDAAAAARQEPAHGFLRLTDDLVEIRHAAGAARVMAFAAGLPQGLETQLGEGGFGLSGGQAQRVALARAFLRDSPLLLLDEPTASLDPGTEAEVMEAIARLCTGRTAIIATHSAQLMGLSGRVIELGTAQRADQHVG
jgi:hypothetical protein